MNSESKVSRTVKLYRTAPHSCSYLADQLATTLFVDPDMTVTKSINTRLSAMGFRRSGTHIYKPDCENCKACISCRVLVDQFVFKRRHNKLLNRNADLEITEVEDLQCDHAYNLYCHYINARHADGDMYPPNEEQYASFIAVKTEGVRFVKFNDGDRLVAVCVMDQLQNGLSAVYTYFDPRQIKRSLGNYAILWQIQKARQMNLPYLYLGYWVKECQKMSYKSNYRPLQMLVNGKWRLLK
ncbi:MAG: arginyltransferase [Gammaproteobacteria bacterium]|nr:arginyltransferase [Gammaproteobacteria bacterium]